MNRWILLLTLAAGLTRRSCAFSPPLTSASSLTTTQLGMGMSRKARRQMEQEQKTKKSRDKRFRDAVLDKEEDDDDKDESFAASQTSPGGASGQPSTEAGEEIARRMEQRPDISNLYVDDATGMEIIQQGRYVMDVITRKAIKLYDDPRMRLAQMFPGVPMEVRQKYRYNWATCEVPQMIDDLRNACSVKLPDGSMGIPKSPSVANKAIDFVIANQDLLGHNMQKTLGKLMMRSAWLEDKEQVRSYWALLQNFLTIENYISAPFRQIIMDSELAIGPNFGNLDLESYVGTELYQRAAAYIVLKGMQCTWEKKVRDAEFLASTPKTPDNYYTILATGDPRRYHPEPDVIWELQDCARVCAMAIEMVKVFVNTPKFFDDLPVELRFLETVLSIQGGTALRKFMLDDFCPKEGITPEALREGMRRLLQQLDSMYLDPYADIRNTVDKLQKAMAVGSDDARNPYEPYLNSLSRDSPGYFQTYTFNHHPMSLVRFLDAKKFQPEQQLTEPDEDMLSSFFSGLTGETKPKNRPQHSPYDESGDYVVPKARASGRPHNLGWLKYLDEAVDEDGDAVFGQVPSGEIIFDE